ncbi:hypothetical protein [Algoriphagus machipongonensis]|uniref:Uncharacterized protein n=1 Tax=Algoriphagus machipongonensis TaxID=388413 RepID=E2RUE1_9BACT|nr:hypothetical protein [Algoriphagus machipongonensis]EFQ79228.1 hypothetical protein ALPR1_21172 [Algoriphagus machipongonensis]
MTKSKTFGLGLSLMCFLGILMIFLFHQSQENRKELESTVEQNMLLVKKNILDAYSASKDEILEQLKIQILISNKSELGLMKMALFAETITKDSQFEYQISISKKPEKQSTLRVSQGKLHIENINGNRLSEWLTPFNLSVQRALSKTFGIPFNSLILQNENIQFDASFPIEDLYKKDRALNSFFDQLMFLDSAGVIQHPKKWAGITLNLPDSSAPKRLGTRSMDFDLLNTNYQAVLTELQIEGENFYILGAISEDNLDQASFKVNYNLLVLLLILVILLVVGIPVFSFLGIRSGDVIKQRTIFSNTISLFFLFVVLGWSASYFLLGNLFTYENEEMKKVVEIETTISKLKEITGFHTGEKLQEDMMKIIEVNEKILVSKEGTIINFKEYDDNSITDAEFKELVPEGNPNYISVKDREYFKYFLDSQDNEYFLTRVFSRRSGKPELVLSTQAKPRENSFQNAQVEALTFGIQAESVPYDNTRRFLVMKQSGELIFNSSQIKTPIQTIQDLVEKEKWEEMRFLLGSEEKQFMDLRMNGNAYRAVLVPLEFENLDSKLWLVYFIDFNLGHRFISVVGLESLSLLLGYLLFLVLLIGLIYYLFIERSQHNWKKTPFRTLMYHPKMLHAYSRGCMMFLAIIVLQIFFLWQFGTSLENRFWVLVFNLIFSLLVVWWIPQREKNRIKAQLSADSEKDDEPQQDDEKKEDKLATRSLYTLFIFLFFFSIGFLPAFGVYDTVNNIENKIWEGEKKEVLQLQKKELEILNQGIFTPNLELARRNFASTIVDLSEGQLKELVFADYKMLNRVSKNMKLGYNLQWNYGLFLIVLLIIILLIGMYALTQKLLQTCFASTVRDVIPNKKLDILKTKERRLFLTGLDSDLFKAWIIDKIPGIAEDDIEIIDCNASLPKTPTEKSEEPVKEEVLKKPNKKKVVLIKNIHCLGKEDKIAEKLIGWEADHKDEILVLGSGFSIRELSIFHYGIATQTTNIKLVQMTELLSDYSFYYVPIKPKIILEESKKSKEGVPEKQEAEEKESPLLKDKVHEEETFKLIKSLRCKKAYYLNLWAELSFYEKKFCYYMAKEGFINSRNLSVLSGLTQKGILVYDEDKFKYLFFDVVFRYFVIDNCPVELIKEFEKDTKSNGTLANYSWLLSCFAILVIGIISYFNRGVLGQLEAITTVVVGAAGIVMEGISKLIPNIGFGKKQ